MINIDNTNGSSFTIPVSTNGTDELEFTFVHHLSGKSIFISLPPSTPVESQYFTTQFPAGQFKYEGLYSVVVKNFLQEQVYNTLAKVTAPKAAIPTYSKDNKKDYELYK